MGRVCGAILCLLAALWAQGAAAQSAEASIIENFCFANSAIDEPIARVVADPSRWNCDRASVSTAPDRVLLRFSLPQDVAPPKFFLSRRTLFEAVQVAAVDRGTISPISSHPIGSIEPAGLHNAFKVPLPQTTSATSAIIVGIDRPTHGGILHEARLVSKDPADTPGGVGQLILIAMVCGMLLMPLGFNFAFYRVLREPFVLWHAAMTMALFVQCVLTSGVSVYFVELPLEALARMVILTFGVMVAMAAMFAKTFIEPGMMGPRVRSLLPWAAVWSVAISVGHAFAPLSLHALETNLYFLGFVPVMALFLVVVVDAWRRGSRAIKFQIAGWTPLLCVGIIRLLGQLTPIVPPTDAMQLFYAGVVLEVLATALGVADRFMLIKRDRDLARAETLVMEAVAERDPLTGLFNRRAIETRFVSLQAQGFDTMALFDLDRFKRVNDTHGHQIGDTVLSACAAVLKNEGDRDTIALRIGGEEFMVLLRGPNTVQRAEGLRNAIPRRVAAVVEGLEMPVTASMGLIEIPVAGIDGMTFPELYARADKLLYEAKLGGRNRSVHERLRVFGSKGPAKRQHEAAA